jgi:peptidoglycan hydrolase-like protein with peptidoglycan-binding domain
MLRVLSKDDNRLPPIVPDGIYGPGTTNAVSAFQRREGLPVTGITDQKTWDKIVENFHPSLIRIGKAQPISIVMDPNEVFRAGDQSPYIFLLQGMLAQLSQDYPTIPQPVLSGYMDTDTMNSLAEFQVLTQLPPSGELDKITWKYLTLHFSLNAEESRRKNMK